MSTCTMKMSFWNNENTSTGFFLKTWAIDLCIMYYYAELQHTHDLLPLNLGQLAHLHHESYFLVFWKWCYLICLKKWGSKHAAHHLLWRTWTPTWCTIPCPWLTCPPAPLRWRPRIFLMLPLDLCEKLGYKYVHYALFNGHILASGNNPTCSVSDILKFVSVISTRGV